MNSPRYAPAGLLVELGDHRIMLDGGPGAEPTGRLDAWLVTDERSELMQAIQVLARAKAACRKAAQPHTAFGTYSPRQPRVGELAK